MQCDIKDIMNKMSPGTVLLREHDWAVLRVLRLSLSIFNVRYHAAVYLQCLQSDVLICGYFWLLLGWFRSLISEAKPSQAGEHVGETPINYSVSEKRRHGVSFSL